MKRNRKRLRFDFYQVAFPEAVGLALDEVLSDLHELPEDAQRNLEIRGKTVRLQSLSRSRGLMEGEMVAIRMDAVPTRASLDGAIAPFDLEDDEGVGEETAFLYHESTGCLVLQRNRYGVTASGFCQYVGEHWGEFPVLVPVIPPGTQDRLESFRTVRRFKLRVAGGMRAKAFRDLGVAHVMDLVKDLRDENKPNVEISVSMGHQRGRLNSEKVKRIARGVLQMSAEDRDDVHSLSISGKTENGEMEMLDLCDLRLSETEEALLDQDRVVSYSERRDALQRVWRRRRGEMLDWYAG